ncbi:MAG: ATP-dependent DNA helicase RecG [Solirubrobacteraceae bacterium]
MPTAGPVAFATSDPVDRERLLAAPVRSYPRPSRLRRPLGVRPVRAARGAEALGLHTVGDLLEHVPHRHDDRREARSVADLRPGDDATVIVEVRAIARRPLRRRGLTLVEATVADATGPIKALWWNQPWVADRLPEGSRVILHGRCKKRHELSVADYELAGGASAADGHHSTGLVPVYPASEHITARKLRELAWGVRGAERDAVEPLPSALRASERLPDRPAALAAVHFPERDSDDRVGRRRLAFDGLLLRQLALLMRRARRQGACGAVALAGPPELTGGWLGERLPFELTADQRRAIDTIAGELARPQPMQRLLMGEVGSGKTVVALHAMLRAVEHGSQAALMAPTETLAEQHFATLEALMPGENVPMALLTGSTPATRREDILGKLASGELALVVGTHALIEDDVVFRSLAVAVVDEQHRFGVRQRQALDRKAPGGLAPHVLHMTATPIPRTLALTQYGDLDVTALRELPAGRRPIQTRVASSDAERARAYERIREELRAGRQAFVVCPLVSESDALQARAATDEYDRLNGTEFRDFRVVLLHGQLRPRHKQAAMGAFAAGEADVLVATSVIEVGIDVPNATVMLVEDADRYGISQLHQLRGRVGRGEHPSLCLLFGSTESPRLQALAASDDGFELAEVDLRLRGEGELIGTRQSGVAEVDLELLERAHRRAAALLEGDPDLSAPEHALLAGALEAAYGADALAPIPA